MSSVQRSIRGSGELITWIDMFEFGGHCGLGICLSHDLASVGQYDFRIQAFNTNNTYSFTRKYDLHVQIFNYIMVYTLS